MELESTENDSFWSFKGADEFIDSLFLMRNPFPMLVIWGVYLLIVLKIGPAYMKDRPPYKLRNLLMFYNAYQVVFSAYLAYLGIEAISEFGLLETKCILSDRAKLRRLAIGHHYYFLAKLTELLDTIFFVLRKKWNQVTFLHVYHHSIVYVAAWIGLKYEPTFSMVFLGTLNSFIHIVMYTYYGLSAFPSLQKYLWWKKYITKMQLIQFMLIIIQVQLTTYTSQCPPSYFLLSVCYSHLVLFIYLFTDFYLKNYRQNQSDAARRINEISKPICS